MTVTMEQIAQWPPALIILGKHGKVPNTGFKMTIIDLNIRRATKDDLGTLTTLNQSLVRHEVVYDPTLDVLFPKSSKGESYFLERLSGENTLALIASAENIPVGYLIGGLVPAESYRIVATIGEVENMFVTEIFRNQGIGTKLIEEFSQWCKKKDVLRIRVKSYAENSGATEFYQNAGFVTTSATLERDV